jgi:acetolactate synthase-1/2/3 large subunit
MAADVSASGVEGRASARCADVIVEALVRAGVDTVYGVPGGAISPVYDALVERRDVRVVHVRHESVALFMATGHARMRPGAVPCVLTTSGPGVTNALTGLATAFAEEAPVVVIGGEVPTSKFGRGALQEGTSGAIDVISMVRTVTRDARMMTIAGRASFQIASAVERARSERGPVFLSLPLDVAVEPVAPRFAPSPRPGDRAALPSSAALGEAARLLESAARPLLLAGSGARGASDEIAALSCRLGCPVITSPKAKGVVPEDAPWCLGVFGYGGHPSALEWLQQQPPDVVLAIGCGLNEVSTNSWSRLVQGTEAFIQIDLDPDQFGRNYRTDVALQGDARAVARALLERAREVDRTPPGGGTTVLEPDRIRSDRVPLAPARVLTVLQQEMPADTIYTADIGEHLLFAVHYLRICRPDQFIASLSLGSMGSGIGAAMGAKLAAPERSVVAICGDYGWQMYGMDLNTCVQENLGVVFAVMNDHRMRMVEAGIERIYGRGLAMDGPVVDFAAAARAHGAHGALVRTTDDLREALASRAPEVPLVLDVRIDPSASFPMNARVTEISNFASE